VLVTVKGSAGARETLDRDGYKSTKSEVEGGSNRDVLPPSCLLFSSPAISINYLCCRWNICSQDDIIGDGFHRDGAVAD